MWKYGTDEVLNVVEVTLLERLSDDVIVWGSANEVTNSSVSTHVEMDEGEYGYRDYTF